MTDSDKGLRILIIEDNPGDQYLLTELLRSSIIKFQEPDIADTLEKAVELLGSTHFDIILLDLLLPDSSGIDTLKRIKEFSVNTPVIILSGINDINIVAEAIRLGAEDYHIKEEMNEKQLTKTILYSIERNGIEENIPKGSDAYVMIKRSELDLMHSSEITKKIMNGSLDAIVCIDISGKIVAWNPQAEKMFGWSQQEILTKTLTDTIIPSQYREAHQKGISNYRITGEGPILNKLIEITAVDHKGREFPIELTVFPLTENNHQFFCAFIRDISERKASEEIVKESETKYRAFFENSLDGILLTTVDGQVLAANPAACQIFGMTEEEVCRAGRAGLVDHDDSRVALFVQERIQTGKAKGEMTLIRKDGSRFPAELSSGVFVNAAGEELTSMIIRDITERKRNEEALIKNELHLRYVLSSTADNFYVINKDRRIILINESAERNLKKAWGVAVNLGTNILDVIPDNEEDEPIRESLERVFAGEKIEYELHLTIKDLPQWVLVNYIPVVNDKGEVIGAYIMSKDISERKRTETGLKNSIERFEMIAATTHDAIWEWNFETGEIWANEVHQHLYGLSATDPVPDSKMWEEKIHPEDRAEILSDLEKTLASDKDAWIAEYRFLTTEGYRNIYDRSYIVRNENKKPVRIMGSMMDITERKKIEEKVRRSSERFELISRTTNDAVWEWDLLTGEMFANETHQHMYGLELTDPVPVWQTWVERIHPDDRPRLIKMQEQALVSKNNSFISEYKFDVAGKGYCTLYDRCYISRDAEGKPIRLMGSMIDITERKMIEESLRESEERYRSLVENAPEALVVFDVELRKFVNVSRSAEKLFKMTREELLQIGPIDLSPEYQPDGRLSSEAAIENISATVAGEKPYFEWTHCDKDGNTIPCEIWLVRLPSDNRILIRGSVVDVSIRKKAELAIKQSEERYRSLIDQASDFIMITDQQGNFIDVNSSFYKTFGFTKEELLRLNISDVLDPVQMRNEPVRFDLLIKGETILRERRMMDKNRNIIEVEANVKMLPDGRILAIARDIRERKKAEKALIESEEKYRTLIEQASDAILTYSIDGKIVSCNDAFVTSTGYQKTDLGELKLTDLLFEEDLKTQPLKFDLIQKGKAVHDERLAKRKDGSEMPVELNSKIMPDGNVMVIARDITERKKAEEEILKVNARFQMLSKATSDIVWDWDLTTGQLWWNDNFYSLLGINKQMEFTDVNEWYKRIHPEDIQRVKDNVEKSMEDTSTLRSHEYRMARADGVYLHFLDRSFVMRTPEGTPYRMVGSMVDMTPIYKVQNEIKESENKLRTIYETEPECIKLLNRKGELLDMNPAGLAMIEVEELAHVKHQPVVNIVLEPYRKAFNQLTENVFNGESGTLEFEIIGLKGTHRWLETHAVPMRDANGTIHALLGVTRDISQKRKAEQALISSEERYRTLVEQAVDAIALYDANGKILDVNTGSVNLLGYSKQELTSMYLSDVLTKEEIKAKPVRFDVLQKGESTVKQRMMKRKDGSIVQTEVRSQQLPDGRFLSVIRDLTERITALEQIEKEKELSDSIINSLPGLFYLIDENGKYIRWNKLKEEIGGYTAEEMRNMTALDFFEGEEKELIRQKIKEGLATGTTEVEAHLVTKSGEKIIFYFTGIAIEYEGQQCLMGTGIDISDRKEAELELESSYKAIRQLTEHLQNIREEERTHIAREIHDELGQKLTVLKMDISWINKKLSVKDDVVKSRLKELLSMLDDTVKSVRRISSELRPSLLDDLGLTAAMEWHLNEFEKRFDIRINFKSVDEILLPEAMKTGLFRIFQESLTNVARHAGAKKVSVTLQRENGSVVLSVTDDGVGFDKQNAATKKTLGILGMQERTSMIGGTYEIISKPGKGTKVVVTVPLSNKN